MIKVTLGNNTTRNTLPCVDENSTIRSVLENATFDYSRGMLNLDGRILQPSDLDNTFAYYGYDGSVGHDECTLRSVAKADNA